MRMTRQNSENKSLYKIMEWLRTIRSQVDHKNRAGSVQKGSALLEAIIALSAVVLAMAGIAIVVTASVSNASFIQDQNQANKYAQEAMEYLRSDQDESYATFLNTYVKDTEFCLDGNFVPGSLTNCSLDEGKFIRTVMASTPAIGDCGGNLYDDDSRLVTVIVKWQSGKCDVGVSPFCHQSLLRTCFTRPPTSTL